jgi:hypothetical protein
MNMGIGWVVKRDRMMLFNHAVGSLYMGTIGLMLGKTIVETEKKL